MDVSELKIRKCRFEAFKSYYANIRVIGLYYTLYLKAVIPVDVAINLNIDNNVLSSLRSKIWEVRH